MWSESASITLDLIPPYSRPQIIDLTVGLGLVALRGASGGQWVPEAVHFTHKRPADTTVFETYFRAPLEFDSGFNGLSCTVQSLNAPLPGADKAMAENASRMLKSQVAFARDRSLEDHVKQSLMLLMPVGRATLKGVAANVGLTPRTLQRELALDGLIFSNVLEELRRELACLYLGESTRAITDVAEQLGYASPGSFTRWFSARFQMSPRIWRAVETQSRVHKPSSYSCG